VEEEGERESRDAIAPQEERYITFLWFLKRKTIGPEKVNEKKRSGKNTETEPKLLKRTETTRVLLRPLSQRPPAVFSEGK